MRVRRFVNAGNVRADHDVQRHQARRRHRLRLPAAERATAAQRPRAAAAASAAARRCGGSLPPSSSLPLPPAAAAEAAGEGFGGPRRISTTAHTVPLLSTHANDIGPGNLSPSAPEAFLRLR